MPNGEKIGKLIGVDVVPKGHKAKLIFRYETGSVERSIGKNHVPYLKKGLEDYENAANPFKQAHAEIKKGKE